MLCQFQNELYPYVFPTICHFKIWEVAPANLINVWSIATASQNPIIWRLLLLLACAHFVDLFLVSASEKKLSKVALILKTCTHRSSRPDCCRLLGRKLNERNTTARGRSAVVTNCSIITTTYISLKNRTKASGLRDRALFSWQKSIKRTKIKWFSFKLCEKEMENDASG